MNTSDSSSQLPLVSIVLPVFNGERFLSEALESILGQTFTDFELLIADNASTDSTAAICQEYAEKDIRIIYHRQPENIGAFSNAEWLYQQAKGEFVMLVGDDDIYEPDCLARYVERIRDCDDVILVYSDYGWIDATGGRSESGLKIFWAAEDGIAKNLAQYIRAAIVLPLMMGLFRTNVVQQAIPFPMYSKFYQTFTGGRDIMFLWKILPKGKVDSIRTKLFYYRIKDRTYPKSWGRNRIIISLRMIYVRWIVLTQHAIPQIFSAQISTYQKILLSIWAVFIFVAEYSLIPIFQNLRSCFRTLTARRVARHER